MHRDAVGEQQVAGLVGDADGALDLQRAGVLVEDDAFGGQPQTPPGQVLVRPAQTRQLFCEATITTDAEGRITAFNILRDTTGEGFSLSRCNEVLRQVGLGERINYFPSKLSGGQKQRVAIARALAASPQLLLADEPTAALDKDSGRDVVDLFRSLAREHGTAIVMVTHDNKILDIADRIVKLEQGSLVE